MSNLESVPPFDVIADQDEPFVGFGEVLDSSAEQEGRLLAEANAARLRVEEGFEVTLGEGELLVKQVDAIIDEMWAEGWAPEEADVNLFVRDFGLILAQTILSVLGGKPLFRASDDVSHLSVWWNHAHLEAFPFHKVLKRLWSAEGESIQSYLDGLRSFIDAGISKGHC